MKHVGDALGDTIVQARNNIVTIGIAPWGVVHKNHELVGQDVSRHLSSSRTLDVVITCNAMMLLRTSARTLKTP